MLGRPRAFDGANCCCSSCGCILIASEHCFRAASTYCDDGPRDPRLPPIPLHLPCRLPPALAPSQSWGDGPRLAMPPPKFSPAPVQPPQPAPAPAPQVWPRRAPPFSSSSWGGGGGSGGGGYYGGGGGSAAQPAMPYAVPSVAIPLHLWRHDVTRDASVFRSCADPLERFAAVNGSLEAAPAPSQAQSQAKGARVKGGGGGSGGGGDGKSLRPLGVLDLHFQSATTCVGAVLSHWLRMSLVLLQRRTLCSRPSNLIARLLYCCVSAVRACARTWDCARVLGSACTLWCARCVTVLDALLGPELEAVRAVHASEQRRKEAAGLGDQARRLLQDGCRAIARLQG